LVGGAPITRFLVIDALARAKGKRYSTFDVVGAGPRVVAGLIANHSFHVELKAYELVSNTSFRFNKYDFILISAMSSDKGALENLLSILEHSGYKGIVIVGGPISVEYEYLLKNYPRIDYVILGEAEIPLTKILEYLEDFVEKKYEVVKSPPTHTPANLLSKNKPWTNISESYPNYKVNRYYVEVLRGCSNYQRPRIKYGNLNCIDCLMCKNDDLEKRLICPVNIPPGCGFCSVPYLFGPARSRSVDSIVEEIKDLIENGAKRIVLSAPDFLDYGRDWIIKPKPLTNPCHPPPNIEAINQLLSSIHDIPEVKKGVVKIMIENVKACLVNEDVVKVLAKYLRGTTVHIGLETGSFSFNEKYLGKPIGPQHVFKAVSLFKRYGLRPYIYLIYGFPFMSKEVYIDTINVVKKLGAMGVEKITLYKYVKLPGTAFENIEYDVKSREKLVTKLKRVVNRVNLENKRSFVKKELEVFLVYSNGKYYGYPVNHGPVVYVKGLDNPKYSGCKALVKIYDVDVRNIWGRFLRIISC